MSRSIRSFIASVSFALAALAAPAPAAASLVYPDYLAAKLQMPCAPGCQLCHQDASGGPGKINPNFGAAARTAMATGAAQTATLDTALATMLAAKTDTDGDGTDNVTELQEGTDPNAKGAELCGGVKYGCGASTIARRPTKTSMDPAATGASILTALVGLFLWRRRRN